MTRASDTARILSGGAVINEDSNDVDFRVESNGNANMLFVDGGNDAVVVGQSAPDTTISGGTPAFQVVGSGFDGGLGITRRDANAFGSFLALTKSRNTTVGSHTIVQDGDIIGAVSFFADDGTDLDSKSAEISATIDGTPGANDVPGRLVFSTTADGASSPTERTRITNAGFFKTGNLGGTYRGATSTYHEMLTDKSGDGVATFSMTNASYAGGGLQVIATRSNFTSMNLFEAYSNNAADREFRIDGAGQTFADGAFNSSGADYAEMFEWSDGNTTNEDRVGKTVVLDGNQIRLSTTSDAQSSIIGVVSARPVVLGDAQSEKWKGKYETDDFGRYIREEYTQTEWTEEDEDGNKSLKSYQTDLIPSDVTVPSDAIVTSTEIDGETPLTRRKLNSSYDSSQTYIPREQRKEFSPIGLVGKLRVTVGQTVGDRWIKMREISDTVHEYLVR
jgi:hypothetical protein